MQAQLKKTQTIIQTAVRNGKPLFKVIHDNASKTTAVSDGKLENHGHDDGWSKEEHQAFIEGRLHNVKQIGLKKHGLQWNLVQAEVASKTLSQVAEHADKFLVHIAKQVPIGGDAIEYVRSKPTSSFFGFPFDGSPDRFLKSSSKKNHIVGNGNGGQGQDKDRDKDKPQLPGGRDAVPESNGPGVQPPASGTAAVGGTQGQAPIPSQIPGQGQGQSQGQNEGLGQGQGHGSGAQAAASGEKQKGPKSGKRGAGHKDKHVVQENESHPPRGEDQRGSGMQAQAPSIPTLPPGQLQEQIANVWNELGYVSQQLDGEQARLYPYGDFDQQLLLQWRRLQGCSVTLQQIVTEMWRGHAGAPIMPQPYLYAHPMYYHAPMMEPPHPSYPQHYPDKPPTGNYP
jgi:hypothetical protein